MTEFWEQAFQDKQEMWGWEPTQSALLTAELFARNGYKTILIPGIGYGRNAAPFVKLGMEVSGIEISEAAIRLASKQFGGVKLFFYDKDTILKDFEKFGLLEISELTENFPFYLIICQKQRTVS